MVEESNIFEAIRDIAIAAARGETSPNVPRSSRLAVYFAKACLLVVILYLISYAVASLPPLAVALFWAAFTMLSMMGAMYRAAIRKAHRQQKYVSGGLLARINNGRVLSIIASFCVSAVCMASLLTESPKWNAAEWGLIVAAAVLFPGIWLLVRGRVGREYAPPFQTVASMWWSCLIATVLLCSGYAACSQLSGDFGKTAESVLTALASTPQPFENSPSALLQEVGIGSWIVDSVTSFGLTQIEGAAPVVCFWIRVGLCATAFFGVSNLLSLCLVPMSELRRAFGPIDAIKNGDAHSAARARYVAVAVALPVALVGGFMFAEGEIAQAAQTEGGTALQAAARQLAGKSAYLIDGTYYDQAKVDSLVESLGAEEANFRTQSFALKNDMAGAYEACGSKAAVFLDWFFSIATNTSVRQGISKDVARQTVEDRFYSAIASKEDPGLTQEVNDYLQAASSLRDHIDQGLREAEAAGDATPNIPDWLVEAKECSDAPMLNLYRREAENALDAACDSGISAALGDGKTLLAYQFERLVYGTDQFNGWVSSVEAIAGQSNVASDAFNFVKGKFDASSQRSNFRSAIDEMLQNCQDQAMALVSNNTATGGLS